MVFYQLDLTRFITVYVGQGLIVAFFIFIAFRILKRDRSRLHIVLSLYYLFTAFGFFLNFIYAPLTDQAIVKLLNTATTYLVFFALIFLVLFNLILFKSIEIKNYYLIVITLFYGILLSFMFLDPSNVKIDPSTGWKPVWSLTFFIFLAIVVSVICVILSLYLSIAIYKRFQDPQLKKKWKRFIYGIIGMHILMYGLMVSNTLNNPTFRLIIALFSITIFLWGYLLYYGVGKQLEK